MNKNKIYRHGGIILLAIILFACGIPKPTVRDVNRTIPESYYGSTDTNNIAKDSWKIFFTDPYLIALIDTALVHNQELNIMMQELYMGDNEVMAKKR
jgi:multidrug efflux system outer membrane protein